LTIHFLFFRFGQYDSSEGDLITNSTDEDSDNWIIWFSLGISLINLYFGIMGWVNSRIELIRNKYVFLIKKQKVMRELEG
jgi:hypothetical protein